MQIMEKALKTGNLTDEEIGGLTNEELLSLYSSMKRHVDFQEHQIDFKHAMHLVRLLRMGYEALTEGIIKVKRPDAQELLSIRNGDWTYEQVIEYAEFMKEEVDRAVKLDNLPTSVDSRFVGNLVMQVQDSVWRR